MHGELVHEQGQQRWVRITVVWRQILIFLHRSGSSGLQNYRAEKPMKHHLVFLHNAGVKRLNNKFWRNCVTFVTNPSPYIQSVKKNIFILIFWWTACSRFWTVRFRLVDIHNRPFLPPLPVTPPHLSFLFLSAPSSGKQLSSNFSDTQPNSSNYKWQPISVTNIIAQRQRLLSALIGGESLDLYVFRGWMSNSYGRTSGNPELTLARRLAGIVKLFYCCWHCSTNPAL